jgi:hypothetical protein
LAPLSGTAGSHAPERNPWMGTAAGESLERTPSWVTGGGNPRSGPYGKTPRRRPLVEPAEGKLLDVNPLSGCPGGDPCRVTISNRPVEGKKLRGPILGHSLERKRSTGKSGWDPLERIPYDKPLGGME